MKKEPITESDDISEDMHRASYVHRYLTAINACIDNHIRIFVGYNSSFIPQDLWRFIWE